MDAQRTILHCDLNSFFASVECLHNPQLACVPMAVAGDPKHRHGIILAKNELAKGCGVATAETIWQAKRKCPELTIVRPRYGEYSKYSKLVNEIYIRFTDLVEPFGIDESWLDVTNVQHLFGDGKTIADTIRETVKRELGLTLSVGVSFNKVFAKMGSDYKKPDATTVITKENFARLLYPLPVGALFYVGRAAARELAKIYITTIGELASADKKTLAGRFGKMGELIHDYANGIDESPVCPATHRREAKSVGNGMTFMRDLKGRRDVALGLGVLCDHVAGRLRKYGVKCTTLSVTIKDPQLKTITRQKKLSGPTHLSKVMREAAMELLEKSWDLSKPIRMLTITGGNLVSNGEAVTQLSLFDGEKHFESEKYERLETAIDDIRRRYGHKAVRMGGVINNDLGIDDEME